MKMKYIIIGIIILLVIIVLFIISNKKKVEISEIKSFYFHYSVNNMMNGYVSYNIDCKNTCKARVKLNGIAEEEAVEVNINNKDIKELTNILEKYNISSWNGFDKVDKNVLDGNGFGLSIIFKNGDSISASGYMKWPENYGKVCTAFDNYFNNLLKKRGK